MPTAALRRTARLNMAVRAATLSPDADVCELSLVSLGEDGGNPGRLAAHMPASDECRPVPMRSLTGVGGGRAAGGSIAAMRNAAAGGGREGAPSPDLCDMSYISEMDFPTLHPVAEAPGDVNGSARGRPGKAWGQPSDAAVAGSEAGKPKCRFGLPWPKQAPVEASEVTEVTEISELGVESAGVQSRFVRCTNGGAAQVSLPGPATREMEVAPGEIPSPTAASVRVPGPTLLPAGNDLGMKERWDLRVEAEKANPDRRWWSAVVGGGRDAAPMETEVCTFENPPDSP